MRLVTVFFLAAALLSAQQRPPQRGPARPQTPQGPPEAPANITGRVLDAATGAPVPRAMVTLRPQDSRDSGRDTSTSRATSNAEGLFQLSNIPPGRYFLMADKPGFLTSRYGARSASSFGELIVLAQAANKTGLDLSMRRQSVLSGRVVDVNGDPVERGYVQLFDARSGRRAPAGGANTDDRGEFRISKVPPGAYKLLASRSGNPAELPVEQQPGQPPFADAPTYFPSALDADAAAPIKLAPGQERTGLEIRLGRSPLINISGRVSGDVPEGRARISLRPAKAAAPGANFRFGGDSSIQPGGAFSLRGVRPGEYNIVVSSFDRGGPKMLAKVPISIGSQNLTDITVPLSPPLNITGRLRPDGDPPFTLTRMQMSLAPAEFTETGPVRAKVNDDGSFTFDGVPRDKMLLNASTPQGIIVKQILANGQPLPGLEIDFATVSGPLEIVLSNKPAKVTGVIEGLPADGPGAIVVVIPEGIEPMRLMMTGGVKTARVAPGAPQFTLDSLRPGNYQIAAFESVGADIYTQPDLWKHFSERTATVKLAESDAPQVKIKLITAEEIDRLN